MFFFHFVNVRSRRKRLERRLQEKEQLKVCSCCKAFYYCSLKSQVEQWKAGHHVDCKVSGHWIVEEVFPDIRIDRIYRTHQ
jgi:hypothetical protein